jgi:hypothetical protein
MKETHAEFVKRTRAEYQKIAPVRCPALGNEFVFFNKHGFNHLLYKKRIIRSEKEQKRRLELVLFAPEVLIKAQSIHKYEQIPRDKSVAQFWNVQGNITFGEDKKIIHVIICKLNNGRIRFLSVYDKQK